MTMSVSRVFSNISDLLQVGKVEFSLCLHDTSLSPPFWCSTDS